MNSAGKIDLLHAPSLEAHVHQMRKAGYRCAVLVWTKPQGDALEVRPEFTLDDKLALTAALLAIDELKRHLGPNGLAGEYTFTYAPN